MSYIGEVRRTAFSTFGAAASGLLVAVATGSVQFIKAVGRHRRAHEAHPARLGGDGALLR
ncbi:hypothetical protein [Ancylobacter novellus]|uniref:hypothetical protein n=1 Tax=Ancylobacter novellus TaxID=921 RepID=UPI001650E6A9|nr:hypothetical protein [Ancylobacter novellus]